MIALLILGGGSLLLGYVIHASHQSGHVQDRAEIKRLTSERDAADSDLRDTRAQLEKSDDIRRWTDLLLAIVEGERDMYETAFRAKFEQEARGDLIHPDEPVGQPRAFRLKVVR